MIDKTAEPEASEWQEDFNDVPQDDPGAGVRFAGCSVENELIAIGAQAS